MATKVKQVDATALKINQAFIISLILIAWVLGLEAGGPWLILGLASVMALGALFPPLGLVQRIYMHLLRPLRLAKPRVVAEDPMPHRFAQGLGAAVLYLGSTAFLGPHWIVVGWALSWIVLALAALNLFLGF